MKQKDIALVAVAVFVGAIISFFASKALFSSSGSRQQSVETVKAITADFPTPDSKYFNKDSIDPTILITIGNTATTNPFISTTPQQ